MTLRKQGICVDCGKPLYGDEYGAAGHMCEADTLTNTEQDWMDAIEYANNMIIKYDGMNETVKLVDGPLRDLVVRAVVIGILHERQKTKEPNES